MDGLCYIFKASFNWLSRFVWYVFPNSTFNVQDSKSDIYKRIWAGMINNDQDDVFVKNSEEGIERVTKKDGFYAFFTESTLVDYVTERQCQLKQVGGLLDSKSYGIGLPKSKRFCTVSTYLNQTYTRLTIL